MTELGASIIEAQVAYSELSESEQEEWDTYVFDGEVEDDGSPCLTLVRYFSTTTATYTYWSDGSTHIDRKTA
ncbi:MAG: hypothetical protein A2075_10330 [Geobacteraceae bacterium GWC2_58_44]|nr:MAG: hypothetical protein A2075_10330 [Geobacteraceae bacterium GWC2_58_44]HBG04545.1 hypothetical protein [Geobacter sp.]